MTLFFNFWVWLELYIITGLFCYKPVKKNLSPLCEVKNVLEIVPYRSPLLPDRYPQQDLFVCSHILQTAYLSEIEYTFFDCQMIKSRGWTTKSKTNRQLSIDR